MTTIWNDVKYSLRQFRRAPGFTATAMVSLGLGIGASTAVFSLLNSIMLRSLPVKDPYALRVLTWSAPPLRNTNFWYGRSTGEPGGRISANVFTYPMYSRFRDHLAGRAEAFGFTEFTSLSPLTVLAEGQASTARALMVSGNFFQALGLSPVIGRGLTPDQDRPDAEPVTVISYAAWQQRFRGDPQVLGQTVMLNNHGFKIIGVLPKEFHGPVTGYRCDYYVPFASQPQMCPNCPLTSDCICWVQTMIRLAPATDQAQLQASLDVLFAQGVQAALYDPAANTAHVSVEEGRGGPLTPRVTLAKSLWLLVGLAGMLLLITCVNLAGLLSARGLRRQHELTVRAALGAGEGRLVCQHLTEGLLIAAAGAGLGLLLAAWGKGALLRLLWPAEVTLDAPWDLRVLGFAILMSTVTALSATLGPAWRSSPGSAAAVLRDRSASSASGLGWGRVLVSVQMGLSLLVLAGAGLFARTVINLYRVETGFDSRGLLVFKIDATQAGYTGQSLMPLYERVRSSLEALPGVSRVAASNYPLLGGRISTTVVRVSGSDQANVQRRVQELHISDSFLSALGIPLLYGRTFQAEDATGETKAVIVNQTLARRFFGDASPIGQRIVREPNTYEIVGVCEDFRCTGLKEAIEPTLFYPYGQLPQHVPSPFVWAYYEVQTSRDPWALVPGVRSVVSGLDPTLPVTEVKTQARQLDESIARERCFAFLALTLAFLAVLLSCIGLYSIMAYSVTRRTREIGVRIALGATARGVAWTVLRSALLTVAVGIAIGVPVFFAAMRLVRSYLFGVKPCDVTTLMIAVVLLAGVGILASWLPARRAAKVDPMEALRTE
jgi:predicted permease